MSRMREQRNVVGGSRSHGGEIEMRGSICEGIRSDAADIGGVQGRSGAVQGCVPRETEALQQHRQPLKYPFLFKYYFELFVYTVKIKLVALFVLNYFFRSNA